MKNVLFASATEPWLLTCTMQSPDMFAMMLNYVFQVKLKSSSIVLSVKVNHQKLLVANGRHTNLVFSTLPFNAVTPLPESSRLELARYSSIPQIVRRQTVRFYKF